MPSLKKVNESAWYAANHMPMKTYPVLVVKRYGYLDADEIKSVASMLNVNVTDLPKNDFYAYISVTTGKKEFTHLATADSPDKAVRRCFAESLTLSVDKRTLFSVLTAFCKQFHDSIEMNT